MSGLKQKKLVVAYSPEWIRRPNFDTPMSLSDLTAAMPLNNKRWPGTTLTFEEVRGCSGAYLIKRILQSAVVRWSLDFLGSPQIIAGSAAMIYGASGAPTGTPANEQQTITLDATGGSIDVAFTFEGLTGTATIPYSATAAQAQALLEAVRSIKPGNVAVGRVGDVLTVTFQGDLAKANVPALVVDDANLTGGAGTAVVATTVPGVQKSHAITRTTGEQGPAIDVVVGFEGSPETYTRYNRIVANDLRVTAARRTNVTAALGMRGSAQVELVPDFVMPACQTQNVIRAAQCRAEINGTYYASEIVRMEYNAGAGVLDGDDAFPFDDPHVERLEQGDTWQPVYNLTTHGNNSSPLYLLGRDAGSERSAALHFGAPGNRVSFVAANAHLQLADETLGFAGQANRSTVPLIATPLEVDGAAPDLVTAKIPLTSMLLDV